MKITKGSPTGSGGSDGITPENWLTRASSYAALHGWFVIKCPGGGESGYWADAEPTPAQWDAWMNWLLSKRIPTIFARKSGIMTVPSEWPEQFYPGGRAPDRQQQSTAALHLVD